MSFNGRMDKQIVRRPGDGACSALNSERSSPEKTRRKLACVSLRERSRWEDLAHCMIVPQWHPREEKTSDAKTSDRKGRGSGGSGAGRGPADWGQL